MNYFKSLIATVAAAVCFSLPAYAAVLDFSSLGTTQEQPLPTRELITLDGVHFELRSNATPYLSANGLGVCDGLDINELCTNPADRAFDDLGGNDDIILFDFFDSTGTTPSPVNINGLSFVGLDGNSLNSSAAQVSYFLRFADGSRTAFRVDTTFADLVALAASGGIQDIIVLHIIYGGSTSGLPFFLASMNVTDTISDIPIPAALPLFLMGLSGLGFTSWRKRNKKSPYNE